MSASARAPKSAVALSLSVLAAGATRTRVDDSGIDSGGASHLRARWRVYRATNSSRACNTPEALAGRSAAQRAVDIMHADAHLQKRKVRTAACVEHVVRAQALRIGIGGALAAPGQQRHARVVQHAL